MSLAILSIFGFTGLSTFDGGGGGGDATCEAAAALDSARRATLNTINTRFEIVSFEMIKVRLCNYLYMRAY